MVTFRRPFDLPATCCRLDAVVLALGEAKRLARELRRRRIDGVFARPRRLDAVAVTLASMACRGDGVVG